MGVDFRYKKLGYIVLNVTNIEKSTKFATEVFGLDPSGEGPDGSRFFRSSTAHHDIILRPAETAAFVRSAWELESERDVDAAYAHYKEIGLEPRWVGGEELKGLALERAFRVVEPVLGTTHEYYAHMTYITVPRQNRLTKFQGGKHFGLVLPDCKKMTDYMVENMGFLVSDYLEGWFAALLRAFPNPNHHSFAPLQFPSPKPVFHHVAWMVDEIDDIGKYLNRAKQFDVKIQFGIGRHPTSGSIHLYLYDPDWFVWEYTLGMEQFPETGARQPRRMSSAPENLDLWQAVPDKEHFGKMPGIISAF